MNILEITGTVVGLVYLWLEFKASIYLWIAGIVMPAIYIVVYYRAGLYADFGINIYYLIAAVYGWIVWKYGGRNKHGKGLPISLTPAKFALPLSVITILAWLVIAFVLIRFTDSNVPWLDSLTTALSISGMWMLARKYVEQWLVWIAVDVITTGLLLYKELYFTAGLYAVYTVIAGFGYLRWRRMVM